MSGRQGNDNLWQRIGNKRDRAALPGDTFGRFKQTTKPVQQAEHSPTLAVYVDGLTRPVQKQQFEQMVEEFAGESLVDYTLGSLQTHAFILFQSIEGAVRARNAIHGSFYPPSDNRGRELFADFVPAEAVDGWLLEEKASPGRTNRWRIDYRDGTAHHVLAAPTSSAANKIKSTIHQPVVTWEEAPASTIERRLRNTRSSGKFEDKS